MWMWILDRSAAKTCRDRITRGQCIIGRSSFGVSILARGSHGRAPIPDTLNAQYSALRALRDGIRHLSELNSNELSAAIMCLLVSELVPTYEALGSEVLYLGKLSRVFIGSRPPLIIQSIRNHRQTFLTTQEWRTIRFRQHPPTSLQSLMTEAACIPSILKFFNGLEAQILDSSVACSAHVELHASSPLLSLQGSAVETRLWFPNITTANAVTHYCGFCIICLTNLSRLRVESLAPSARKK
ncbi:hypothetical protein TOPH_08201 [Tolypocladium ophioglossoides CBS 100239]|uniref:Uncharacterized protein n=1 Tax=Tolypocladium ophioglossoides (strain CBS 100239) TaxID=1163406 RepID=A0A0L0MZF6_TOLOC|nr:hypothetical protein TOPH_08201 [Tolypocladium ophioglossoides CBS 100239]